MVNQTLTEATTQPSLAQIRCIGCGAIQESASRDLRCPGCGDLLEITYPGWTISAAGSPWIADELKAQWRQRRTSPSAIDQSGVWRFREVLPVLGQGHDPITMFEGNTPLHSMP